MNPPIITETIPLETPRLLLRRFCEDDAQAVFDNWASDGEVTKYLRWNSHTDVGETAERVRLWVADYTAKVDYYYWAIVPRGEKCPVGGISIGSINRHDETAETGYCLGRAFWGRGYMTEALRAVLRFAFEQAGLNRVEAAHSVRNPASGRVMQKAGMRHEGTLRQGYRSTLGFEDCELYAIVKNDFLQGD